MSVWLVSYGISVILIRRVAERRVGTQGWLLNAQGESCKIMNTLFVEKCTEALDAVMIMGILGLVTLTSKAQAEREEVFDKVATKLHSIGISAKEPLWPGRCKLLKDCPCGSLVCVEQYHRDEAGKVVLEYRECKATRNAIGMQVRSSRIQFWEIPGKDIKPQEPIRLEKDRREDL